MAGVEPARYRGRFAPSPTGPLHFGSLVAAVASFLQARHAEGEWLVRIDDLDTTRVRAGASVAMLADLEALGLTWDGQVVFQSERLDIYGQALAELTARGHTFPCGCARSDIPGDVYPGTCRNGLPEGRTPRSIRLKTTHRTVTFKDAIQGTIRQDLAAEVGDFVVQRADGVCAYHLATAVDDSAQGITEVLRGGDLLASTPRQIYLQRLLQRRSPAYAHVPVAVDPSGRKLSKRTRAAPVVAAQPVATLLPVLEFLGQQPPAKLRDASVEEFWAWAIEHWRLRSVPVCREITVGVGTVSR